MASPTVTLNNGGKMALLGLGTFDATDENEVVTSLNKALEVGYRHIDTAYAYQNEKLIGKVLKEWFDAGKLKREDIYITTKLPVTAIRPDKVEAILKESLESLQMDYVDLYLLHFPVCMDVSEDTFTDALKEKRSKLLPNTDHEGVWKKMEEQVKAGRAKGIGLSNYNQKQVERILKTAEIKPASLQVENHVFLQQNELVEYCQKNQIVVVAYCPLGSPNFANLLKRMGLEQTKPLPDILANATIAAIGKKHNKSVAQVALRFLIQRTVVAIPKSVKENRLVENIFIFDFKLDSDDMNALKKLDLGEDGRICDWKLISSDVHLHPDYPFAV